MKTLVVYYSRDGSTRKVAKELSRKLGGDLEEIVDLRNRSGAVVYITAGRDAMRKRLTEIKSPVKDPSEYDLVVVGTPIWGWSLTPAVRTYLGAMKGEIRAVACFCTEGGSGGPKAFKEMEEVSGIKPVATLELTAKEVASGEANVKIADFVRSLS